MVAGGAADDIGLQCGGWTVGWQGGTGAITPGTTLLDGLRAVRSWDVRYDPAGDFPDDDRSEIGVVCIAESPYAEGPGDAARPTAGEKDRLAFARLRARTDRLVLVIYSGRPLVVPELIDQADAVVAAWLPGSEGAALANLLTGVHPFEGRTTQPWPRTFADLDPVEVEPRYSTGHGLGTVPEVVQSKDRSQRWRDAEQK
jgi:beta-glucosidase